MSPRLLIPSTDVILVLGCASAGTGSSRTTFPPSHSLGTPASMPTTRPASLTSARLLGVEPEPISRTAAAPCW